MPRAPTVIRHPDDLDAMQTLPGLRSPGRGRIQLAPAEELDIGAKDEFERRLNRSYFACGCDKAALGLILGLLGFLIWAGFGGMTLESARLQHWVTGILVVIVSSAVGKLIGRVSADREFKRTVTELKRVWKAPRPKSENISYCG